MDGRRFDAWTRKLTSRRIAVRTGGFALAASVAQVGPAAAQDATPVATPAGLPSNPHPSADATAAKTEFLFVQAFESGTWAPKAGENGVYLLTLSGAAVHTVYFTDRPERVVGTTPTSQFLDALGFTPDNPPNAAIVAQPADGAGQEVLVIELFNPVFDPEAQTLTYEARVLADYSDTGLLYLARQQQDYELSESFGGGSLFIDDCSDTSTTCYQTIDDENQVVGTIDNVGCCFDPNAGGCRNCNDDYTSEYYGKLCYEEYSDVCNYYTNGIDGWDCFVYPVSGCTGL